MKRILVVVDNLNSGGIASVVLNISDAIDKEKYTFDYIIYKQPNKEVLERIDSNGGKYFLIKRVSETTPFHYVKNIREIIRKNGPYDAIHAHTSSFIWLACLAAKKENIQIRIGHAHGSKNAKQFLFSEIIYSVLKFYNRKYCTNMITCAEMSGKYVFGNGFKFIPNFVDESKYLEIEKEELNSFIVENNIPRNVDIYCFIGYLGGEKNPMFALKVFKGIVSENSNSYLLIAGDGPERNEILDFVKENKLENNVKILGNTKKIKEILHSSHFMLVPSFSEGMSMALLEAQIAGVNCIVSNGVPITNDIKAGLFHYCPTLDIECWTNKIKMINKHSKIGQLEIINSINKIGYDKESVIQQYENIYSNLSSSLN